MTRVRDIRKLLAVDDEETILAGYRTGFARTFNVLTATTADAAIRIAREAAPEIVLVDLRLSDAWGITLIRRLRKQLPTATILLVSGYVSVATAVGAIRAGADRVVSKPATPANILAELETDDDDEVEDERLDDFPTLARVEWEHIMRALTECHGNVSRAAKRLGMRRTSLQRKLKRPHPEH